MSKTLACCVVVALLGLSVGGCGDRRGEGDHRQAFGAAVPPADGPSGRKVIVYYMHRTIRCMTCNELERMVHQAVMEAFAPELAAGRVQWKPTDFQERRDLAERYGVAWSSVVLVALSDGKESSHRALEEIWSLKDSPDDFRAYVVDAVRAALGKAK